MYDNGMALKGGLDLVHARGDRGCWTQVTLFLSLKEILMYDNGMAPRIASAWCMPTVPEARGRISTATPPDHSEPFGGGWATCHNSLWQDDLRHPTASLTQTFTFQSVTATNPGLPG